MRLQCLKCTVRTKCMNSPKLLCTAQDRISRFSDEGQKSAALYRRKKIAVGDITGLGTVCCTFFNHGAKICYGLTTGESICIDDILPTVGTAYRCIYPGIPFTRPKLLTLDGWTCKEACWTSTPPTQTKWTVTVFPDLYAKKDNIIKVHIVSDSIAISAHFRIHKEVSDYLNETAAFYCWNPQKTFVFGQDFDPDFFRVNFKKTGIIDRL